MAVECPRCKLLNPPSAQVCDCGHLFTATLDPEVSFVAQRNRKAWEAATLAKRAGLVFFLLIVLRFAFLLLAKS